MKKWYSITLNIVGIFYIWMAVIHIRFWDIYDWKSTMECSGDINRSIMYTLDIIVIIYFIAMALVTLFLKKELLNTILGKYILIWFSIFGFSRAVMQITLWSSPGLSNILICLALGTIYILPVMKKELVWIENK